MGTLSPSCVVVQLGQGGNQISTACFAALAALANPASQSDAFFRESLNGDRVARAVLIDMEPKVGLYHPQWPSAKCLVLHSLHSEHGKCVSGISFTFNRVILYLNGTLCQELVSSDFLMVLFHTKSNISFHLWCILVFEFE